MIEEFYFKQCLDVLIPGFGDLTQERRQQFINSESGQQLKDNVEDLFRQQQSKPWLEWLAWHVGGISPISLIVDNKGHLLENLAGKDAFQCLQAEILAPHLQEELDKEFGPVSQEELLDIAKLSLSKKLLCNLVSLKKRREASVSAGNIFLEFIPRVLDADAPSPETAQIDLLIRNILEEWRAQMDEVFKEKFAEKNLERIKLFQTRHPFINYSLQAGFLSLAEQLKNAYQQEKEAKDFDFNTWLRSFFSSYFSSFFNGMTSPAEDDLFFDMREFNLAQAKLISQKIIDEINSEQIDSLDVFLKQYSKACVEEMARQALIIDGIRWEKEQRNLTSDLFASLTYLFAGGELEKFTNDVANAHAFMQATGISGDGESYFATILDSYNVLRHKDHVNLLRSMTLSLMKPFIPLLEEYRNIAKYEKNSFVKIVKALIPLIVMAAVVVAVMAALAPLNLPGIAITVVAIPTLIAAFAAATFYVKVKNKIANSLRENYYGGREFLPEFQVNQRMISIFVNKTSAAKIKEFYFKEIEICAAIEAQFKQQAKNATLTEEQMAARKNNIERSNLLCAEWYDIHSNQQLGVDKVKSIVLGRLNEEGDKHSDALRLACQKEFIPLAESKLGEVCDDLTSKIGGGAPVNQGLFQAKGRNFCFFPTETLDAREQLRQTQARLALC